MASARPATTRRDPPAAVGLDGRAWGEASAPRKIRKRVLASKLLAAATLLFALFSQDVYEAGTLSQLALQSAAFLLLMTAAMGRVWASAHIADKKGRTLVRDGPYSIVRNPLYFFSFLAYLGAGLAFHSLVIALFMAAVFFVTHWGTVLEEERWLRGIYGAEFEAYFASTPRFLPKPWILSHPRRLDVEPARFSRVLLESSLILLVFPVALAVDWCQVNSLLPVVIRLP
jgi:protein-S-isoprenylcysteine O-methyltransferase Ste14